MRHGVPRSVSFLAAGGELGFVAEGFAHFGGAGNGIGVRVWGEGVCGGKRGVGSMCMCLDGRFDGIDAGLR